MSNGEVLGNQRAAKVAHIGFKRGEKMTDAALKIGAKRGTVITASQVVKYLIDNYTEDAIIEMGMISSDAIAKEG